MENHTAKHFVLQLGSLVSLYLSLSFLIVLLFGFINLKFPDAANMVWEIESSGGMVRLGIAMVLVFFPTYLILTRLVNTTRRQDPDGSYLGLTKWLIYLSLLVAGIALLADLATVIMTFLDGEITIRFILKALVFLVVIGVAFFYYIQDARSFWLKNEKCSIRYGAFSIVAVIISVIAGFTVIETPSTVREQKLDATQISNLQEIQWRIQDYLAINGKLPESLDVLAESSEMKTPDAPEDRASYRYELTATGFKLCAEFSSVSASAGEFLFAKPQIAPAQTEGETNKIKSIIVNPDNWEHATGDVCFERVVK